MAITFLETGLVGVFTPPATQATTGIIPVGSLVVAQTATDNTAATFGAVTDESGNTYTQIGSTIQNSQFGSSSWWYSILTTQLDAGDDIVGTDGTSLIYCAYSGTSSTPLDQQTGTKDQSFPQSQPNSGNITTGFANELLIGGLAFQPTTITSPTSGFTDRTGVGGVNAPGDVYAFYMEDRIGVSIGTYASAPTFSTDRYWSCSIASFKVSAGVDTGLAWIKA